jgi:hypothetical protein
MRETLNKPKFAGMRAAMEKRARSPPRIHDIPMNSELEKRVKVSFFKCLILLIIV